MHEGEHLRIDAAQPVDGVDGDGEEGDEHDHDDLGEEPEAEPHHEHRRDGDDRNGLRGDHVGIEGAVEERRVGDGDGDPEADDDGGGEADECLLRGHPSVPANEAEVVAEGLGDLRRRGQEPVLHRGEKGDGLPDNKREHGEQDCGGVTIGRRARGAERTCLGGGAGPCAHDGLPCGETSLEDHDATAGSGALERSVRRMSSLRSIKAGVAASS